MQVTLEASLEPIKVVTSGVELISGTIVLSPEGKQPVKLSFTVSNLFGCKLHLQFNVGRHCVLEMRGDTTKEMLDGFPLGQKILLFSTFELLEFTCRAILDQYRLTEDVKYQYDMAGGLASISGGKVLLASKGNGTWTDTTENIEALLEMLESQPVALP